MDTDLFLKTSYSILVSVAETGTQRIMYLSVIVLTNFPVAVAEVAVSE